MTSPNSPRTIGVSLNIGVHAWYQRMIVTERAEAERRGWNLTVVDAEDDPDVQHRQIIELLDAGVSAIILSAVRADRIGPALDECLRRGVPVVTESIEVRHPAVVAEVRVDDVAAGVALGEALGSMSDLGEDVTLLSVAFAALSEAHDRERGFLEGLRRHHPHLTVWYVDGRAQVDSVREAVTEFLKNKPSPQPSIVFGVDDESIIGTVAALGDLGLDTGVPTATYGITAPSGIELLESGTLTAGAAMFAENHGRILVDLAIAAVEANDAGVPSTGPKLVNPPSAVVTAKSGSRPWTRFYDESGDDLPLRWDVVETLA